MGRHQVGRERRNGKLAASAGVMGADVLQAAAPAVAAPATQHGETTDAGRSASAEPYATTAAACVSISRKTAWSTDGQGEAQAFFTNMQVDDEVQIVS